MSEKINIEGAKRKLHVHHWTTPDSVCFEEFDLDAAVERVYALYADHFNRYGHLSASKHPPGADLAAAILGPALAPPPEPEAWEIEAARAWEWMSKGCREVPFDTDLYAVALARTFAAARARAGK